LEHRAFSFKFGSDLGIANNVTEAMPHRQTLEWASVTFMAHRFLVVTKEAQQIPFAQSLVTLYLGPSPYGRSLAEAMSDRRESMKIIVVLLLALSISLVQRIPAAADEFKRREAQIADYKRWLDSVGPSGSRFWVRLDAQRRPHKLYLGEGFYRADFQSQERFVDTFSNYLAGHPEKFMLIDLFDGTTNKPVGEFGWGGFKMYSARSSAKVRE
jgi:hypothetical protein